MANDQLLRQYAEPNRKRFDSYYENYLEDVKLGLEAWYISQLMNYIRGHTPDELLREDYLANKERIYNLYVDNCNQLGIVPTDIKTLSHKEQDILEDWNDVFTYTKFDPNLES